MKRKLAIVDDDQSFRTLLGRVFSTLDSEIEIVHYSDGELVCQELKAHTFNADLMLLDLNMPRVNGYEVLHHVRDTTSYCDLPVVVMTVSTSPIDREKSMNLGATSFLIKPMGLQELEQSIKSLYSSWTKNELC